MEAEIHAARLAGLPLGVGSGPATSDDEAAAAGTDTGPQEAPEAENHSADAAEPADADADADEPADLEALEELDELDEAGGHVEIVGYEDDAPEPSGSAAVGLYDVEAESAFEFDAGPLPVHEQAPHLGADLPPVADEAPERALEVAAASGADAIFARLRSITSRPASEPPPEREEPRPAAASGEEVPVAAPAVDEPGEAAPAGEAPGEVAPAGEAPAGTAVEASEPDDLMSAARAVAVGGIARRLKRLVVDEQGELLDAMRRSGSRALRGVTGARRLHTRRAGAAAGLRVRHRRQH